MEGRSLVPFLHGSTPPQWRKYAVSEFDYSATMMAKQLELEPRDARLFMVADHRWKFMHAEGGFRPMLFDMETDPDELVDLGDSSDHDDIIDMMYQRLGQWARRPSQRTTRSEDVIKSMRGRSRRKGVLLGLVDGSEVDDELLVSIRGKAAANFIEKE